MIFNIRANIIDDRKCLLRLNEIIKKKLFKKPLIICDKIFKQKNYVKTSLSKFKFVYYLDFSKEPSYEKLDETKKKLNKLKQIDCIVAIGGGSCLDFSKGLALLMKNSGPSIKYMGFPKKLNQPVPLIAVPTTVSTGSEVVYNAVFTSKKKKIKLGINTELNYPKLAILDTKLLSLAPNKLILRSAIASLMRSIETFTSVHSNYITRIFAKQSFELLFETILNFKEKKYEVLNKLQWGCIFSMFALSNSSSGTCGIINYYLSVNYNIPQPLAYNFTAIEFIKKNLNEGYTNYLDLAGYKVKNNKNKNLFLIKMDRILQKNTKDIKKAKEILQKDKDFEKKMFNVFKISKFNGIKNNPIYLNQKELKKILIKIKS